MLDIQTLISKEDLQIRVSELAEQISQEFGDEEIVAIGILKGSIYFLSDLTKKITSPVLLDFMRVSSYGNELKSSGKIQILLDCSQDLEGKNVILVEDIVDTGLTMHSILKHLEGKNPKSLKVVSLLSKPELHKHKVQIDYLGFEIGNKYVIGYGLDAAEKYRNLEYIGFLQS